jgi:hypothetical protein
LLWLKNQKGEKLFMARRKSAIELEELAKIKRSQAAARLAERNANPKPYKPKKDEDYTTVFYRDPIDNNRLLSLKVANGTLTLWGGSAAAGLLTAAPANTAVVEITRGSKIPIVKVRWFFGDETPVVVPATATHGRWIKFYDTKEGQAHHQVPFTVAGATPDLDGIILAFYAKLNTEAEKSRIIGAKGRADLVMGYGNQYTTLARVAA